MRITSFRSGKRMCFAKAMTLPLSAIVFRFISLEQAAEELAGEGINAHILDLADASAAR